MIILDTNVVSEFMRSEPSSRVLAWLRGFPLSDVFITTITQAEVLFGIEILPAGKRKSGMRSAASAMFEEDFAGRVLPFDADAAQAFAAIAARKRIRGRPMAQLDAQIAAIASVHSATLATRNGADFEDCGVQIVNPWDA